MPPEDDDVVFARLRAKMDATNAPPSAVTTAPTQEDDDAVFARLSAKMQTPSSDFQQAPLAPPSYDTSPDPTATTVGGPMSFLAGINEGIVRSVGSGLKGLTVVGKQIGEMLPDSWNPDAGKPAESFGAYRLGQGIDDWAKRTYNPNNEQDVSRKLGEGLGGMSTMIVTAAVGGAPAMIAQAYGDASAGSYEDLRSQGADESTALRKSIQSGTLGGGLMAVLPGPSRALGRFMNPGNVVQNVAKGAVEMGALGMAQTAGENYIQDRPLGQGVAEAGWYGMGTGALASGAMTAGGRLLGPRPENVREFIRVQSGPEHVPEYAREILDSDYSFQFVKGKSDNEYTMKLLRVQSGDEPVNRAEEAVQRTNNITTTEKPNGETSNEAEAGRKAAEGQEGLLANPSAQGDATKPPAQTQLLPDNAPRVSTQPLSETAPKTELQAKIADIEANAPPKLRQKLPDDHMMVKYLAHTAPERVDAFKKGEYTKEEYKAVRAEMRGKVVPAQLEAPIDGQPPKGIIGSLENAVADPTLPREYANKAIDNVFNERTKTPVAEIIYRRGLRAQRTAQDITATIAPDVRKYSEDLRNLNPLSSNPVRREFEEWTPSLDKGGTAIEGAWETKGQNAIEHKTTEQTAADSTLTEPTRKAAAQLTEINRKAITAAREKGANVMVNRATGERFKVNELTDENRLPRIYTSEGIDMMRNTASEMYTKLLDALAKKNNITLEEARAKLKDMTSAQSESELGMLEVKRTFEHMFSGITNPKTGEIVKILETDPVKIAQATLHNLPNRAGYISEFGTRGEQLEHLYIRGGGNPLYLDRLKRALNGVPGEVDQSIQGAKSKIGNAAETAAASVGLAGVPAKVAGGLKILGATVKSNLLSGAVFSQMHEGFQKIPAYLGFGKLLGGYKDALKNPIKSREMLENQGVLERVVTDLTADNAKDIANIINTVNPLVVPFNAVNKGTATAIGMATNRTIEQMKRRAETFKEKGVKPSGYAVEADRNWLRQNGFTPSNIQNMLEGKASDSLYNQAVKKMVSLTQGDQLSRADMSATASSGILATMQAFMRYPLITLERLGTQVRNTKNRMSDPKATGAEKYHAMRSLATYVAGSAAGGWLTYQLQGMFYGRSTDTKDDGFWGKFMKWVFPALGGGPAMAITGRVGEAISDSNKSVADAMLEGNPTIGFFNSLTRAYSGEREYRDLTGMEKVWKFAQQGAPLLKGWNGIGVIVGWEADPEIKRTVNEVMSIKRKNGWINAGADPGYDADRAASKAIRAAMMKGDEPMAKALFAELIARHKGEKTGGRQIHESSNRGSMLLSGPSGSPLTVEQQAMMKKELGERRYAIAEAYDGTLAAITKNNLAVAGQYYLKYRELKQQEKESGDTSKDLRRFESANAEIGKIMKAFDEAEDKAKRDRLIEAVEKIQSKMLEKAGSTPPPKGKKTNMPGDVKRIMEQPHGSNR